ncbi:MAG: VCBS repeat-containing protein [Burkholderiales bacterium]|nr:VCBS repeat-containing protein [Burkholderiales bacterium]
MSVPLGNDEYFDGIASNLAGPALQIQAIGDLNGDGFLDLVLRAEPWSPSLSPLRIALGNASGGFTDAQLFIGGNPLVAAAYVLVGEFTGDGRNDLVVYDAGYYDWPNRITRGNEPVLYAGTADGKLVATTALTDAIAPWVTPGPIGGGKQRDLTMGVKDVVAADIDGDGDLDMWVESTGSANLSGHFMINQGNGTFVIDHDTKITEDMYYGPGEHDVWRYGHAQFLDVNGDGAQDLVMLQIRDNDIHHVAQSSFVFVNDGDGNFPAADVIRLPQTTFYYGYTSADAADAWDINGDGRQDLVLLHTRNDDVSGSGVEPPWTGTFIQVLVQDGNGGFVDQTATRIGSQAAWSASTLPAHASASRIDHADVNHDGITDMILGYGWPVPSTWAPVVFLGQSDGSFKPSDVALLTGGNPYFGEAIRPFDLDGDAYTDFVHLDEQPGANGIYEDGGDDFMAVVVQAATGPLGGAVPEAARTIEGTSVADTLPGGAGNDTITGFGGNDAADGAGGIDTAVYAGTRNSHTVTVTANGLTVAGGADGTDSLQHVERLAFVDISLAMDLDGNAGLVAKILGAVFGASYLANEGYAGIGLDLVDGGMGYQALMQLAIDVRLGASASSTAVVTLLYTNVVGTAPPPAELAYFRGLLDGGTFTPGSLGVLAADTSLNAANIGLAGLALTGLEYV